jgi:hypothetical protein
VSILTNTDLKMVAIVLIMLVLEGLTNRTHQNMMMFSDSTPVVSCTGRLVSSKAESKVASQLLGILAIRGRMTNKIEQSDTLSQSSNRLNADPYKGWPANADALFLTMFSR